MPTNPCRHARHIVRPVPHCLVLTLIITSLALTNWLHAADWKGTVESRDGVSHVLNPPTPMEPALTVPLQEQWRRGESDAEEVIFALLDDIAVADDGTVYVLDLQLSEVQVFAPDGEYVRTIGREGEGPGEFTFPRSIFITPEGLIGVVQSMPGKIVLLTPEGDAAGNYPLPDTDGMFTIQEAREAGGRVFLYMRTTTASDNNQFFHDVERVVRLAPDGAIDATMGQWERETDFTRLVFDEKKMMPVSAWDGAGDGTMYVAGHFDDYRIDVWSPQGKQVRSIEREYELRKRTAEERERRGPLIRVSTGEGDMKTTVVKSETDRAVLEVFPRDDGSLWVLSRRGAYDTAEGELCVLDEFDARGRYVRELHLKGEGDLDRDAMEIIGNRVFLLTDRRSARYASMAQDSGDDADEAAPMTLICYEIDGGLSLRN